MDACQLRQNLSIGQKTRHFIRLWCELHQQLTDLFSFQLKENIFFGRIERGLMSLLSKKHHFSSSGIFFEGYEAISTLLLSFV